MTKWVKRILVGLFIIAWVMVLLTPTLAVVLARNGQIQIGSSEGPHTRLFMLQEARNEGVGLERSRRVQSPVGADDTVMCLRTTVRYWMWTPGADDQSADYCQCTDAASGSVISAVSPACDAP